MLLGEYVDGLRKSNSTRSFLASVRGQKTSSVKVVNHKSDLRAVYFIDPAPVG
jgi:hypothetical protein